MSNQLFILLQGGLAFGAPLTLAFIELWKLRRKAPAPVGGGDPKVIYLNKSRTTSTLRCPEPADSEQLIDRAA